MGTKLQAARRARDWSQARLIHELQRHAAVRELPIASPASLKTLISRWENGHASPDEFHRRLRRAIFAATDADLGLLVTTGTPKRT